MIQNTNSSHLDDIIKKIKDQVKSATKSNYIPNILEFCNSPDYLDLEGQGVKLFPMQNIILKCFYRGQPGNENLSLTEEEISILKENNLNSVIDKYYSGSIFRELVLVLGRRSGKNLLASLISLYEAMRLLEIPGGSPFKYYKLAAGNPIYILTVATAADQAKLLFTEIKSKLMVSPYFKDKIGFIEANKISLLTPEDKEINESLLNSGMEKTAAKTKGNVVIMSGHSNSSSLLGKRVFTLLFDEVASYQNSGGEASGDRIYTALGPSTADFKRVISNDEYGTVMVTDSKVISISSPRSEQGILFKIYNDSTQTPTRLAFKLPTWKINLLQTEKSLREDFRYMSPSEFGMEFGAEFSGTSGEKFIPDIYVDNAILLGSELGVEQKKVGVPGIVYYAHLDPASTSHNYALIMLHTEDRILLRKKDSRQIKERVQLFVVDHVMVWRPEGGKAIKVSDVDNYIVSLAKKFRMGMVSYDAWNSLSSIQLLRSKGIPTKITPFRSKYKKFIYDFLENLLIKNELALPRKGEFAQLLETELKCLKRIYTPNGYKIKPDLQSQVTTDDLCDCLAGACATAMDTCFSGYPHTTSIYLPEASSSGRTARTWNIGNATYTDAQWKYVHQKFGI